MKESYGAEPLLLQVVYITIVLATFPFGAYWLADKPIGTFQVSSPVGLLSLLACTICLLAFALSMIDRRDRPSSADRR